MKTALLLVALCSAWSPLSLLAGDRPIKTFTLNFQDAEHSVPKGELWRLTWRSPYKPGDVVPGYDVRISKLSSIWIGRNREAQAFAELSKTDGFLDFSAARQEITLWLPPGTTFSTANDSLKISVDVFPDKP